MQPFLRWAGSKRSLVRELARLFPLSARRYIEPFSGSACLYFRLEPDHAILSDLNIELMQTYSEIRRDVELVLACFRRFPRGAGGYYRVRAIDPKTLAPAEAAGRFLYLNRYCFNGIFRTNRLGRFNVPYGPPRKPLTRFEERVRAASSLLQKTAITAVDFGTVLECVDRGDFVYLDPPYVVDERRIFSEYLPGSFSRRDLHRLKEWLQEIDRRGAHFVLSYEESVEARSIASEWNVSIVSSRRNVAGFTGARRISHELIVSNMETQ